MIIFSLNAKLFFQVLQKIFKQSSKSRIASQLHCAIKLCARDIFLHFHTYCFSFVWFWCLFSATIYIVQFLITKHFFLFLFFFFWWRGGNSAGICKKKNYFKISCILNNFNYQNFQHEFYQNIFKINSFYCFNLNLFLQKDFLSFIFHVNQFFVASSKQNFVNT